MLLASNIFVVIGYLEWVQETHNSAGSVPDALPAAPPIEVLRLSDREVAIRQFRAEPVEATAVLVHGLGGSALNWTDLQPYLSGVRSVAMDLSGFGYSEPPPDGDYTVAAHAGTVIEVIERLNDGPVHLLGNSMGGAISVVVAARRPDLIRSLTLISPALPQYTAMRGSIHLPVLALPAVGERLLDKFLQTDPAWRAQGTVDACFADPSRMSAQRMAESVAEVERRDELPHARDAFLKSLRGLLATYRDSSDQRPWRLAEQVACPTLVLHGRRDKLVDAKGADRATRHFNNVRVVVLPDCGHVAMMEHPEEVATFWVDLIG